MSLSYRGRDPSLVFDAFSTTASRLGFELHHVYRGRGDATWRFRVERLRLQQLRLEF
jgi:hypothetical protein